MCLLCELGRYLFKDSWVRAQKCQKKNYWAYLAFAPKLWKHTWFYNAFAQTLWTTSGFAIKPVRRRIRDLKFQDSPWWTSIDFTRCSLANGEQALVLLSFRSKIVKRHVLMCFHSKMMKSSGFTMFFIKHNENPMVLRFFHSKMVNNYWFYCKTDSRHGFGVWNSKTRLDEKALVLLSFVSQLVRKHRFYSVLVRK